MMAIGMLAAAMALEWLRDVAAPQPCWRAALGNLGDTIRVSCGGMCAPSRAVL